VTNACSPAQRRRTLPLQRRIAGRVSLVQASPKRRPFRRDACGGCLILRPSLDTSEPSGPDVSPRPDHGLPA